MKTTLVEKRIQACRILRKMLIDREYTLEEDSKEDFSIRGYKGSSKIITFLSEESKLTIHIIKEYISIITKEKYDKCIIVYQDSVTSSAKKSLEIMEYNIELFSLGELQLNITEHRLVPLHERASKEEKEYLEKTSKGRLPFILLTDPVCRYYYFQRGEYIRITRADKSVIYRVVK